MRPIINVPLSKIIVPSNVRSNTDDRTIRDLAQSMKENGQEVEIRVFPGKDGAFYLKAGHRRLAAAKLLGWESLRAVVDAPPEDEAQLLVQQTIENEQRMNLSYLDKARVYARLKELGWSQRQIAATFAISDADVSLALATLRAAPRLQQAVEEGRIKPSAIEPLLSQPLDVQEELADRAIRERTVRKIHALVKAHKMVQEASQQMVDTESQNLPEDVDPREVLAIEELKEALEHLENVRQTGIRHPELRRTARPTVEQLVRQAASIKKYLDGRTWDDTKDLV